MNAKRKRILGGCFDLLVVLVLAGIAVLAGRIMLDDWRGPALTLSNDLYIPSVMWASGKGFVNVAPAQVPALREFLDFKTPAFSGAVPADVSPIKLDAHQRYHRYLLYSVAVTWRLFGVSWDAMKILIFMLFGVTGALLYGLFRLGMGRLLSMAGTLLFMFSPAGLGMLWNLRDFGKLPFVLAALLILGFLIKCRVQLGVYLGFAVLLGIVEGVGIGFRRDLSMCVLPSVIVLAVCSLEPPRWALPQRGLGIVLLLVSFAVCAWPILRAFHEEGSLGYHDVLMGFATSCDDDLGLQHASYERMYAGDDAYVTAAACSHAARVNGAPNAIAYRSTRFAAAEHRLLADIVRTFPADMATRAYAAMGRVLSGDLLWSSHYTAHPFAMSMLQRENAMARHFQRWGVWYAAAALLLLSGHSLRMAAAILFLLVYFSGYSTLQFQFRHCFHLGFAALWFPGFLIDKGLDKGLQSLVFLLHWRVRQSRDCNPLSAQWRPYAFRMAGFAAVVAALGYLPLHGMRAYQAQTVGNIINTCASAALEPIETETRPLGEWTLFRPVGLAAFRPQALREAYVAVRTEYLVAEFAPDAEDLCAGIRYEARDGNEGCSRVVDVDPTGRLGSGSVRYFFPVYECLWRDNWSRFAGLALPAQRAGAFKGLYRVRDLSPFTLLPNLSLRADAAIRPYQVLDPPWKAERFRCAGLAAGADGHDATRSARACRNNGDRDGAVRLYRDALNADPRNLELALGLAETLETEGALDAALNAHREAINLNPRDSIVYDHLDASLAKRNDLDARADAWRGLVAASPQNDCLYFYLGTVLNAKQDTAGAVEAYRKGYEIRPDNAALAAALGHALIIMRNHAGAIDPLRAALDGLLGASQRTRADLIAALCGIGAYDAAQAELDHARKMGMSLPEDLVQQRALEAGVASPR